MLSARKGSSSARARQQRNRFLPKLFFGFIGVCLVCCLWLLLSQTTKLQTNNNVAKDVKPPIITKSNPNKVASNVGVDVRDVKKKEGAAQQQKVAADSAKSFVVCGGHQAPSCQECPQGNGAGWCHGECVWCSDRNECMSKNDYCPTCSSKANNEAGCNKLQPECSWCDVMNTCMHVDSVCPKERMWKAPDPEPWFTPPNPIDKYGKTLSVVLPCGCENEFFERTIRSVYAATPPEVLHEIVVVDDNSVPPLEPMFTLNADEYKVKFVRSDVSLGLIDAKHQGAQAASGDIIVFFDCHVKPALGYWEPFVREIADNPKRVVVPTITALDVDTWVEQGRPAPGKGGMSKCYVTLDSDFKWTSDDKPWVPAMSGGLLAIGRDWFFQIGGHDQAMKGWGGENIDLSLRIWRCGGEIVSAPTSYVGHMWRSGKRNTRAKYKMPANSAGLNRARAFKAHAPSMFANKTVTFASFSKWKATGGSDLDVESIEAPMRELKCHDFDWYLDFFSYIYRDGGYIPRQVYQLTSDGGNTCLSLKSRGWGSGGSPSDGLIVDTCTTVPGLEATNGKQYWHKANRNPEGKCCSGLRAWNTDQCIVSGLKTSVCSMSGQPAALMEDGTLKVGGSKCLSVDPLRETSCEGATKWEILRPFEPQEFTVMSQELKDKW